MTPIGPKPNVRTDCPDTRDGLSAQAAADTLSLLRECPSACPSAGSGVDGQCPQGLSKS
jgi:hypothetical protein